LTGLEFFIFSHRVSAYVHLYWNLRTISWNFRASFEACNATALQIFQQRNRVADFSATHPRCRFFSNASALQGSTLEFVGFVPGASVLQKNQQRRCVADFSATQMRC
jgi:hypothetical protein